jgi:FkbM family methyltransferase
MTAVADGAAFAIGQGAGSGWDLQSETAVAIRTLKSDAPVIVDVGANDGRWILPVAARLKGRAFRVVAIECAPICLERLSVSTRDVPEVTIIPAALSDRSGEGTLWCPTVGSGLASLHQRGDTSVLTATFEPLTVRLRTLDDLMGELGVDVIDYLKMDIEGHELMALHGASGLMERRAIRAIAFEFGSGNVNSRTFFRDLWQLLEKHGFGIFRMAPGGKLVPIPAYDDRLEYFRGATNYLAVLRD